LFFWSLEILSHPTFANLTESFEAWEYRNQIKPRLKSLARSGYVRLEGQRAARKMKLTERGRLAALGGMDPLARWRRRWDGKWRLLIFDLPARQTVLRQKLWRWLRSQRFGYLQQSVWISPDPVDGTVLPLKHLKLSPERFTVIEGRPVPPDRDHDLVEGAWDFATINLLYSKVMALCKAVSQWSESGKPTVGQRRQWLTHQRQAWLEAVSMDPLLPLELYPDSYQGKRAYELRAGTFARVVGHAG
jgi:phenylacetic acid degradation operon negative regulatory protein